MKVIQKGDCDTSIDGVIEDCDIGNLNEPIMTDKQKIEHDIIENDVISSNDENICMQKSLPAARSTIDVLIDENKLVHLYEKIPEHLLQSPNKNTFNSQS